MDKVFLNQEKMPFFLSIKTERKIFVRDNFKGALLRTTEDTVRFKVMLNKAIRNNDF